MIFDTDDFEPIGVSGGKLYGVLNEDDGRRIVVTNAAQVAEHIDADELINHV